MKAWQGSENSRSDSAMPTRKTLLIPVPGALAAKHPANARSSAARSLMAAPEMFAAVIEAPFGAVGIRTKGNSLRELVYLPPDYALCEPTNEVAAEAARQLALYFQSADFTFSLPLISAGTDFQQRVWAVIAAIPRGEVLTYGQVARRLGSAPRAVGQACGANWFPMVIPCHRVTATGGLGGFANQEDAAGFHLGVKRWLLAHEGVQGF